MENLIIVKVGGAVLEDENSFQKFLIQFNSLAGKKILVHGGGRTATQVAEKMGIKSQLIDGRRVTNKETMDIVTMVYGGLINKKIVAFLASSGINAIGLTGADLNTIKAVRRPLAEIDYGLVGDISEVNSEIIHLLLSKNFVPVFAPLTHDGKGNLLNTNADSIASSVAIALTEFYNVFLVYCFEKEGVMLDIHDNTSIIKTLTRDLFLEYSQQGIIHSGMLPKLENCFKAIESGVKEVVITSSESLNLNSGTRLI